MSNIQPEVLKTLSSKSLSGINLGKKRTHSFNVDYSQISEDFVGRFTVHHPTQLERMQMGVLRSSLLGGNISVDVHTDNLAQVISTLDIVLDEKPEWFDIDNPDLSYEIMESVYLEYNDWVNSFRKTTEPSNPEDGSKE